MGLLYATFVLPQFCYPATKLSTRTESTLTVVCTDNDHVLGPIKSVTSSCYSLERERVGMKMGVWIVSLKPHKTNRTTAGRSAVSVASSDGKSLDIT